jgi:hypothetical protein
LTSFPVAPKAAAVEKRGGRGNNEWYFLQIDTVDRREESMMTVQDSVIGSSGKEKEQRTSRI